MIIDSSKDKLRNAILFFLDNTNNCNKIKLFKLLYFLDFVHCQEIGRPVTGLKYFAWPKGPVPVSLNDEIELKSELCDGAIDINLEEFKPGLKRVDFIPRVPCDNSVFSKREKRILIELAKHFKNKKADEMIEMTHLENHPWDVVYNQQGLKQAEISYELVFKKSEYNEIKLTANESNEMRDNYK